MADSNYSSAPRQDDDLAQDDPFAELTRIMGHDPRPTSNAPLEQPADDLALELENELLGGLDDGESDRREAEEEFSRQVAATAEEQPLDLELDEAQEVEAGPAFSVQPNSADFSEPELDAAFEESLGQALGADEDVSPSWQPEAQEGAFAAMDEDATPREFSDGTDQEPFVIREEDFAALDSDFAALGGADVTAEGELPVQASVDDVADAPSAGHGPFGPSDRVEIEQPSEDAAADVLQPDIFTAADAAASTYQQLGGAWEPTEDSAWDDAFRAEEQQVNEAAGGAIGDWSPEQTFTAESAIEAEPPLAEVTGPAYAGTPEEDDGAEDLPPMVETVDVPEQAVVLADNLDIPEVSYREEVKPAAELDEIDELLAGAFGEAGELADPSDDGWKETTPVSSTPLSVPDGHDDKLDEFLAAGIAAGLGVAATTASGREADDPFSGDLNGDFAETYSRDWDGLPEAHPAALAPSPGTEPPADSRGSRFGSLWLMAAAVVGGVVILGGVTVFALTFNGGDSGAPVLVKADNEPMKVQPQDPGGTVIPNQDSQVYQRVSGEAAGDARPAQTQLVSTAEEPVDLPGVSNTRDETTVASNDGAQKLGDRLYNPAEDAAANEDTPPSLAPRRVRSLVVRPDGTMVPHSVPEPQQQAASSGSEQLAAASGAGGTDPSRTGAAGEDSGAEATAGVSIPSSAPIPPSRPANVATARTQENAPSSTPPQPNAAQTQVAAIQPQNAAPAAAAPSPWSVQIASQPTAQEAQQSYQELAQRYGNLLQGKGVNIVKAEIDGRGTFYRVRIPSASKDQAVQLCTQLKSAGGNCFVSQ